MTPSKEGGGLKRKHAPDDSTNGSAKIRKTVATEKVLQKKKLADVMKLSSSSRPER